MLDFSNYTARSGPGMPNFFSIYATPSGHGMPNFSQITPLNMDPVYPIFFSDYVILHGPGLC